MAAPQVKANWDQFRGAVWIASVLLTLSLHIGTISGQDQASTPRTYEGDKVVSFVPTTKKQLRQLRDLEDNGMDFWVPPHSQNHSVELHIPAKDFPTISRMLEALGLRLEVVIPNLQELVNTEQRQLNGRKRRSAKSFDLNSYHDFHRIMQYLDRTARRCGSSCDLFDIGASYESRPLKVIKIGTPSADGSAKPAIWIDAGLHAREWIAPATALYMISMLTRKTADPEIKDLRQRYDWYIMPVANPDGYQYTHEYDRFWRKTRSPQPGYDYHHDCAGVDPNRNFDFHWGEKGISRYPCSPIYAGSEPFSEPETRGMRDFLLSKSSSIKLYISLHAYSQYILKPWAYTIKPAEDSDQLDTVARSGADAIRDASGVKYVVGTPGELIYSASGSSLDWAKGEAGIKYAYALELRDKGRYGYVLPRRLIRPTAYETLAAVKAMAQHLLYQ